MRSRLDRARRRLVAAPVLLIMVAAAVAATPGAVVAQQTDDDPSSVDLTTVQKTPEEPTVASGEDPEESSPGSEVAGDDEPPEPCVSPLELGDSWVDWINRRIQRSVCASAMWFDHFFGDDRALDEYNQAGGRVSGHLYWTEHDGLDPKFRFRVRYPLPNLDNRVDAFIGRETRDQYLTDVGKSADPTAPLFGVDDEEELLIGLGYHPMRGDRQRFRVSVGAKMAWPPEPYVKARYRYIRPVGQRTLFRWRQTVFWEIEDQVGTTTNLDLERHLGASFLLRWTNAGTVSGRTSGVDWWSNVTLFHSLSKRRALAYSVWGNGETDRDVPVQEYGLRVVYRQRVYRDWLFVDVGPTASWPREEIDDVRELSLGAVIGAEMVFGAGGWQD